MLALALRKLVDYWLGKFQLGIGAAVVIFGATLKADAAASGWARPAVTWMQENAWWVVACGPLLVALIQVVRRRAGNQWAWAAMQKILDEFRHDVFGELESDPVHYHRVTLFRFRKNPVWPKNRWLVAVARSDHVTQGGIQKFQVPDDGDKCQGVAGRAWLLKEWVRVPNDGDILAIPLTQNDNQLIKDYAKKTHMSEEWVRNQISRNKKLAKSYAAVVVQLHGKPWGVLVLDSRGDGTITPKKCKGFSDVLKVLTPLLERCS